MTEPKSKMCAENAPEGYLYNHNEGAYQLIACKPLGEINPEPGRGEDTKTVTGEDTETVTGEDVEAAIADVMAEQPE